VSPHDLSRAYCPSSAANVPIPSLRDGAAAPALLGCTGCCSSDMRRRLLSRRNMSAHFELNLPFVDWNRDFFWSWDPGSCTPGSTLRRDVRLHSNSPAHDPPTILLAHRIRSLCRVPVYYSGGREPSLFFGFCPPLRLTGTLGVPSASRAYLYQTRVVRRGGSGPIAGFVSCSGRCPSGLRFSKVIPELLHIKAIDVLDAGFGLVLERAVFPVVPTSDHLSGSPSRAPLDWHSGRPAVNLLPIGQLDWRSHSVAPSQRNGTRLSRLFAAGVIPIGICVVSTRFFSTRTFLVPWCC